MVEIIIYYEDGRHEYRESNSNIMIIDEKNIKKIELYSYKKTELLKTYDGPFQEGKFGLKLQEPYEDPFKYIISGNNTILTEVNKEKWSYNSFEYEQEERDFQNIGENIYRIWTKRGKATIWTNGKLKDLEFNIKDICKYSDGGYVFKITKDNIEYLPDYGITKKMEEIEYEIMEKLSEIKGQCGDYVFSKNINKLVKNLYGLFD